MEKPLEAAHTATTQTKAVHLHTNVGINVSTKISKSNLQLQKDRNISGITPY